MSRVLRERAVTGVPTLFSPHRLDVVERLCDRIVIIRAGRLVADGTITELQATAAPRWRAVVEPTAADSTVQASTAGLPEGAVERDPEGRLTLGCGGSDEQALLRAASALGRLRELGPARRPLTEIFRESLIAPAPADDTEESHS